MQPTRSKRRTDADREFDTTSLKGKEYGKFVHRDYAAHFFRWGFAGRYVTNRTAILDVGCGVDCSLARVLNFPRKVRPRRYVGVDVNPEPASVPGDKWVEFRWGFDFTRRWRELGAFPLVVSFEALEHMREADGRRFLAGLRGCLAGGGTLLLSTPVFDGRAAANHLHEWGREELWSALGRAGLEVVARHGTFASEAALRRVATPAERVFLDELARYYSWEVLSCFMAPKYPDASRNCVWVCRPAT